MGFYSGFEGVIRIIYILDTRTYICTHTHSISMRMYTYIHTYIHTYIYIHTQYTHIHVLI